MNFFELIKARRSIRHYQERPVEPELLDKFLKSARMAPSAGNLQAWSVVVVRDPQRRHALAQAALDQDFIAKAPVVLCFFQDPQKSFRKYGGRGASLYSLQDATIACAYAQLAAAAQGLGSCWVGAFYEDKVRSIIQAPHGLIPVALLPIGYPAEEPAPTPRQPLDELVHEEKF